MKISSRISKCLFLWSLSRDLTVQCANHHTLYFFLLSHLHWVLVIGLGNKNQIIFQQLAIRLAFREAKWVLSKVQMLTQVFRFFLYTDISEAIACCTCRKQSLVWGTWLAPYNWEHPGWVVFGLLAQKEHVCGWKERGKKPVWLFCLDLILPAQRFYITPSPSWEDTINYDDYYSLVVTYEH